jgi:hypothetical protein
MSWFRRTPHIKPRPKLQPHRSGAIGHKVLQEAQEKVISLPNPPPVVVKNPPK